MAIAHDFGQLPTEGASGKWTLELCINPSTGEVFYVRQQIDVVLPRVGSIAGRRVNTQFTPAQSAALKALAAKAVESLQELDSTGTPI